MLNDKPLLFSCICALLLLSVPLFFRNPTQPFYFTDPESYYHLHLADLIRTTTFFPTFDPLSYGGRPIVMERGMSILLALVPPSLLPYLPLLLGILTLFLFGKLLSHQTPQIRITSIFFVLLSPTYLYLFSSLHRLSAALPLLLLTLFSYTHYKTSRTFLLLAFTTLFSTLAGLLFVLYIFFLYLHKKTSLRYIRSLLPAFLLPCLFHYGHLLPYGIPPLVSFPSHGFSFFLTSLFSGFGGQHGLHPFLFILGIFGIFFHYRQRYHYLLVYPCALALFFLVIFYPPLLFFAMFPLAFLAAVSSTTYIHKEWRSSYLKHFILLTLLIGILVPSLFYFSTIDRLLPDQAYSNAFTWLRDQPNNGVVFSHYDNGYYITAAQKTSVIDPGFLYAPDLPTRREDSMHLFHDLTLYQSYPYLVKYNIRYILLDTKNRHATWINEQRELPFLLKYGKGTFVQVYHNDEVTIWEVFLGKP